MLSGKLALITGGGSGIGLETAKLFSKNNAIVILVDINEKVHEALNDLQKPISSTHSSFQCDVSSSEQVNNLFKQIQDKYPEQKVPNVIVNSAGIVSYGPFLEITEETFDRLLDINLKGTVLVSQVASKLLVENYNENNFSPKDTYASIINIGSIAGRKALQNSIHYCASKAAVESVTRSIAREMGKFKIRCNCICPGFIRTPLLDNTGFSAIEERYVSMTPLGRLGDPDDVAKVCLFLASDLSGYINGTPILCDGGYLS